MERLTTDAIKWKLQTDNKSGKSKLSANFNKSVEQYSHNKAIEAAFDVIYKKILFEDQTISRKKKLKMLSQLFATEPANIFAKIAFEKYMDMVAKCYVRDKFGKTPKEKSKKAL